MKIVGVLFLILLPLLGFAQEKKTEGMESTTSDEAALEELENHREERQKTMQAITKVAEATEKTFNPTEELKKIGYDKFTPASLMNNEVLAIMEKTLKAAHLNQRPVEEVRETVISSFEGTPIYGFVKNSPRLVSFMADIVRDDKAILSVIEILKSKERLKRYLYFWIGIMFAAYYTKSLFISKFWKGGLRFTARVLFSLTISTITLSTFGLLFKDEMKPIVTIVKKYL